MALLTNKKMLAALVNASVIMAGGLVLHGVAVAGIVNTRHNLTGPLAVPPATGSTAVFTPTNGNPEICAFCHTPHGANTAAVVPLWNKQLNNPTTYQTYNSLGTTSLDGATAPVGSVSLACLSCHDGTTAMNTMINVPGSGGYVNGTIGQPWAGTWTGSGQSNGIIGVGPLAITRIGQDLRNDHPVGIQYGGGMPGGGAFTAGTIPAGGTKDKDFNAVQYANLNGNSVWWVDTAGGTAGVRDKTDMMLYTRTDSASVNRDGSAGATLAGNQAFVECASCHDPHTDAQPTFLRTSNAGSALCLACHNK